MSEADAGPLIAAAAVALTGVPFRAGGRDPARGLDCVGVVLTALSACGAGPATVPAYTMRRTHLRPFDGLAAEHGLRAADGRMQPGDVLVCRVGPAQFHAAIAVADGRIVHAHAGLRRVVCTPLPPDWTVLRHWRYLT
jgi:cell wall-associated NlpC family hydrolase